MIIVDLLLNLERSL